MRSLALVVVVALSGCGGGAHLEPHHGSKKAAAEKPISGPSPAAPASSPEAAEPERATRLTFAAIGCFTGGVWAEALGALGEERTLATTRRCRTLSTEALGAAPDDEGALVAARSIDDKAVTGTALAIEKASKAEGAPLGALVRAVADASREALVARKAAESLRKGAGDVRDEELTAKTALVKLDTLNVGSHSKLARLVALVLAADHVESSRGLDARGKILTASPGLETAFGVTRPAQTDGAAWIAFVNAAAKAGGQPVDAGGDEKRAFAALVTAFAARFEALAPDLRDAEAREAASGYAKRLRAQLEDAAKKEKKDATKKSAS